MFTSPSGSILTPDQAQELDDEFFQSMPLDYFHSRIASLIGSSGTSSSLTTTLAAHFARALGVDDPSTLLNCSASSRELQVAIDSFALRHHAAEAIVRLYHALAVTADRDDPAPCVWARIADGPRRTIDLIQQSRAHLGGDGHGSFWALVLPASAATATASEQDRFNTALNVMAFWLQHAMQLLVRNDVDINAAHNKVKHGLAIRARHELMTLTPQALRSDDTIPINALTGPSATDIFNGPILDYLARPPRINGRKQGLEITTLGLDPAILLAETWMMATTYGAMFHLAAVRHFSGRDLEPEEEIAPYPPLPLGPTPDELLSESVVGMRQALTTPPDGGELDRPTGIGFQKFFQVFYIDFAGKRSGTVTDD
jgi:hypothetical protein